MGIGFFARPLVLDTTRVKENCFSLSFIPAPSWQSWWRGQQASFAGFWRFCPIAKTVGGRQRPSGQAMREKQCDSVANRAGGGLAEMMKDEG
jgi:hypothetical protein